MKTEIIRFAKEKDTKNTVRFDEVPASGKPPVIGTLYLQKWFCGEATECEVTLEIKEGAQEKYQSEDKGGTVVSVSPSEIRDSMSKTIVKAST